MFWTDIEHIKSDFDAEMNPKNIDWIDCYLLHNWRAEEQFRKWIHRFSENLADH